MWESAQGGAYLAHSLLGFCRVLLVDATPALAPGEVRLAPLADWEKLGGERRGTHGMSLSWALEMLKTLDADSASEARQTAATLQPREERRMACLQPFPSLVASELVSDVRLELVPDGCRSPRCGRWPSASRPIPRSARACRLRWRRLSRPLWRR